LYFDLHADLNTPTSVLDGALDWTGVAHALALPDTVAELRELAGAEPLTTPERVLLFAHDLGAATAWERRVLDELRLARVPVDVVRSDPVAAAEGALTLLDVHAAIVVHFDVDVVNFTDAPLSENTSRSGGMTLDTALAALRTVVSDSRVRALTVTEVNPHHAAADGEALPRLVSGLVAALAGAGSGGS
jgi:arginase